MKNSYPFYSKQNFSPVFVRLKQRLLDKPILQAWIWLKSNALVGILQVQFTATQIVRHPRYLTYFKRD